MSPVATTPSQLTTKSPTTSVEFIRVEPVLRHKGCESLAWIGSSILGGKSAQPVKFSDGTIKVYYRIGCVTIN